MMKLIWKEKDKNRQCMFCKGCIAVCPSEALKFVDANTGKDIPDEFGRPKLTEKPKLVWDKDKCTECKMCISSCPEEVIKFV